MGTWQVTFCEKKLPKLRNPVLIEGLPGIGNVGKLVADFITDELKAKKLATFLSPAMPHSVFVNEQNLVELPTIDLYYKKFSKGKNDVLILVGDFQPADEQSCYLFSNTVLDVFEQLHCKELVTLGGIALREPPEEPHVYCTGTDKKLITAYKRSSNLQDDLYGFVGQIVGVSGVLLGLAGRRNIQAVSLLAETHWHPLYLGVKGARELLKVLNSRFGLHMNIKTLDKEITNLEKEIVEKTKKLNDPEQGDESRYIG